MKHKKRARKNRKKNFSMRLNLISRIKYFVFIVLPVISLVIGIYFLSLDIRSSFHVRKIMFTGNTHLTDEELKTLAELHGNENLIMLSSRQVYENIIESAWITSVSIRKTFPDTLHIFITESEPFALLDLKGRLFIVDERGRMLQELKESPIPFLPVISGTSFGDKEGFSEALNLTRAIKKQGLMFEKDHIEIIAHKTNEMAVNLDGVIVKVGAGDYEDKLLKLMEMEEEINRRKIHIDYIDLRFANRVVVKPMSEVIN